MSDKKPWELIQENAAAVLGVVPHARALGLQVTHVALAEASGRAPFRADLVGDPRGGALASGVIITLLDTLCGLAAVAAFDRAGMVATLDLRIDHLRAPPAGADVLAQARCVRVAGDVAFVTGLAFEAAPEDPIARASAVFSVQWGAA